MQDNRCRPSLRCKLRFKVGIISWAEPYDYRFQQSQEREQCQHTMLLRYKFNLRNLHTARQFQLFRRESAFKGRFSTWILQSLLVGLRKRL